MCDIVGLYMAPPERAVVLCVDEKSQTQTLDRLQPMLPLRPGNAGPANPRLQTHRHHVALCRCRYRHRSVEFRKFPAVIEKAVPKEPDTHLVLDNYSTHKMGMIHKWSLREPRYHLHFTPTSASWLNQVERWFAEFTNKRIRRGSCRSTRELEQAIDDYLAVYNKDPNPFIWTKSAGDILASLQGCRTSMVETGD